MTEEKKKPEVNYERLAQFLNRVMPSILEVLDESYGTNAFEDYEPKTDDDSLTSTQFLQKINKVESDSQVDIYHPLHFTRCDAFVLFV